VGVGGSEGADQGGELQGADLALEQGAGEGHALGLAVGGADAGMKAADAGSETPAGHGIGGVSVGRDGPWEGGGHRGGTARETKDPLNGMPVLF
jgi:hypothetical protein